MINAENMIDNIITKLSESSFFSDKKVIRAYSKKEKPILLDYPVIAVGLFRVDFENAALGQDVKAGEYTVFADVFIPYSACADIKTEEIVSQICKSVSLYSISSVYVEEPRSSKYAQCITQRVRISFNDEIFFGQE